MSDFEGLGDASAAAASLDVALGDLTRQASAFGTIMTGALRQAAVNGRELDDVLKGIVLRLSDRVLTAALAPLGNLVGGLAGNLVGALTGSPVSLAFGGVVGGPTGFAMGDGRAGVAGEAGPEAVLPLARGPDGRLGVRGAGGGMNVTFNVTTPDAGSFQRSEAQVTAMLARAVGRGRRGL
jgi:phage-related minor tail protein